MLGILDILECLERDFSRSEGRALSTDVEVSSHLHKGSKVQNLPACSASETFIFLSQEKVYVYQEYTGVRIPSYYLRAIRGKSVFHSPIRRGSYVGNIMRELWFRSLLNFRVATDPWYHPVSYHMRHSPHPGHLKAIQHMPVANCVGTLRFRDLRLVRCSGVRSHPSAWTDYRFRIKRARSPDPLALSPYPSYMNC